MTMRDLIAIVEHAKPYVRSWLNVKTGKQMFVDDTTISHGGMLRVDPDTYSISVDDAKDAPGSELEAIALAHGWVRVSSDTKDEWRRYVYIQSKDVGDARAALKLMKAALDYNNFVVDAGELSFALDRKTLGPFLRNGTLPS